MKNHFKGQKYAYTKIRSTMLCLSGFELYRRWVPLICITQFTLIDK